MMKKQNNKTNHTSKSPVVFNDWFYMCSDDINVVKIRNILQSNFSYSIEIWEDAGVLELEISSEESIDFEQLKPYFKDEAGASFLEEHKITSLFIVTLSQDITDKAKDIFTFLTEHLGGFFCADTEDFQPRIMFLQ